MSEYKKTEQAATVATMLPALRAAPDATSALAIAKAVKALAASLGVSHNVYGWWSRRDMMYHRNVTEHVDIDHISEETLGKLRGHDQKVFAGFVAQVNTRLVVPRHSPNYLTSQYSETWQP